MSKEETLQIFRPRLLWGHHEIGKLQHLTMFKQVGSYKRKKKKKSEVLKCCVIHPLGRDYYMDNKSKM
jgi:hypothetical protein